MLKPDFRGARGSNTGDDFHELWALRNALTLLDQDSDLAAVTVEGLRAEDEAEAPKDQWDGVDCTFYYGATQAAEAECIVIDQLKYSAARPDQTWTVARLTKSTNKAQDNSVLSKLAKAFTGIKSIRPDLVKRGKFAVRLISNQEVDPAVVGALSNQDTSNNSGRAALQRASGLRDQDFEAFASSLDLSESGQDSRFALEERVIRTISEWTEDDARMETERLMRFIRKAMMPESKGEYITRESVFLWMGFSDPAALFPCPAVIENVERLIPREASRTIIERLLNGEQRLCLHGEGGCGKTAALQEIEETLVPAGSVIIMFDCYGGGRYLDSDAYRHRPREAFLQLSNDLARQLRVPLLVSRSTGLDYPRLFKKRLERAAEVVASRDADALLIVAVDAADNSVTAASAQEPPERSFIRDFVALGKLPANVRLILTARTGRLALLNLPREFIEVEIGGFSRDETAAHVRGYWEDVSNTWIDDFHHLSGGNPRVQRYALDNALSEPANALSFLRPSGKNLDQVFQEQLQLARQKIGNEQDIRACCSGLVALPRPVPIADLAAVSHLEEDHIRDLCSDLAPGIRQVDNLIGFADEDFESFLRGEVEAKLNSTRMRIAEHFLSRHREDAYAATHLATALLASNRRQEIIDLIQKEQEPTVIGDPVLRREVQLHRLRIGMKVCREAGNNVDAMITLLIGADALKTSTIIRRTLIENPDLAANFAQDTSSSMILRDPDEIEAHGPLLFQIMAVDSRKGDGISVREGFRHVRAWMQRRQESIEEQKRNHPDSRQHGWPITFSEIASETEAAIRTEGPQQAVERLRRWRPKSVALGVALELCPKLIANGEASLLELCLSEADIRHPWDLFLLTPLALAGKEVELSRLETALLILMRRGLIGLEQLGKTWREDNLNTRYLDTLLTACEIIIGRGGNYNSIVPVLERFADHKFRRRDKLFPSQAHVIDLSLRAHALLEKIAGRSMTLDSYWIDPPPPAENHSSEDLNRLNSRDNEKKEELSRFIGPLLDIYETRAQILTGLIPVAEAGSRLQKAISHYHGQEYRYQRNPWATEMRTRVASSLSRLLALHGIDRPVILDITISMLGKPSISFISGWTRVIANLALQCSLHHQILETVSSQARIIKSMKISAEEKIAALIELARLLLPISQADAEGLFNEAIEVATEVNDEAVHEIALFAPLTERAVKSMSIEERQAQAQNVAIVTSDASIRLGGIDVFYWEKAARALATLDTCSALAATARWEDSDVISRDRFLPSVLLTGLSTEALTPVHVAAASPLLDWFNEDLISQLVQKAVDQNDPVERKMLAEHIAREEVLRSGKGARQKVSEILSLLVEEDSPGSWMNHLADATALHSVAGSKLGSAVDSSRGANDGDDDNEERSDPFADIDWENYRFTSPEEIEHVFGCVRKIAQATREFVSAETILDRIGDAIELRDRTLHLEALSHVHTTVSPDYELAQAIARRIDDWRNQPSVRDWCHRQLFRVVVKLLPGFCRWLDIGHSPLPALLEKSGASDEQIVEMLLEGLERHVDGLGAPTVYALVGLLGQHCAASDCAKVLDRYSEQLVKRIPHGEREVWDTTDVPDEITDGIARFLYALMGDVDLRIRWRAAHTVRNFARLGVAGVINRLIELYETKSEPTFRTPDAPFYWLAARLWLMVALDRIADESPSVLDDHGHWLLEKATDEEFPHVLLRSFAKRTVSKLVTSGKLQLDASQQDELRLVNTSRMDRKGVQGWHRVGFDKYAYQEDKERRFRFDSMDTLPYWYTGALRVFGDVGEEEFLDIAEEWIVDRWAVHTNPWRWEDEPRKYRSPDGMDHRDGTLPTLERYHTHLEWHAMWCTVGRLLETHPLARDEDEEDDYYSFERWLSRKGLTVPPLWLADFQGMKPLQEHLWFSPEGDIDDWVENVNDNDFFAELGLTDSNQTIVVAGHHDTRSSAFQVSARVETALVSPATSQALVRALQTVNDSWNYRIPPSGDEREIDDPPYRLIGWLDSVDQFLGIDERDPLRYGLRAVEREPSTETVRALNLAFIFDGQAKWVNGYHGKPVFVYEAWGDNRGDEREEAFKYDKTVRSSGWRLRMDKSTLQTFLNELKLDLIIEIELTRGNRGYEYYSRYDKEKKKEAIFDRVILFRRDGTIEAAEGRLGTWSVSRP